ncbi:MAG: hypothetical protein ACYSTX_03240 [Planctomycetota bacterium]|jgi:hypothetical protein
MVLTGKIYQWDEVLPLGKVVVANSLGHIKKPTNGVVADVNGKYTITVNPDDYLLARGSGMRDKLIKVSEVCKQNSCNFDIRLEGMYSQQDEVVVVGHRPQVEYKKPSWSKYLLIAGISLVGVAAILYGIKKLKK